AVEHWRHVVARDDLRRSPGVVGVPVAKEEVELMILGGSACWRGCGGSLQSGSARRQDPGEPGGKPNHEYGDRTRTHRDSSVKREGLGGQGSGRNEEQGTKNERHQRLLPRP